MVYPPVNGGLLCVASKRCTGCNGSSFRPVRAPRRKRRCFLGPVGYPRRYVVCGGSPHSCGSLPLHLTRFNAIYHCRRDNRLRNLAHMHDFARSSTRVFYHPSRIGSRFLHIVSVVSVIFRSVSFRGFRTRVSLHSGIGHRGCVNDSRG